MTPGQEEETMPSELNLDNPMRFSRQEDDQGSILGPGHFCLVGI